MAPLRGSSGADAGLGAPCDPPQEVLGVTVESRPPSTQLQGGLLGVISSSEPSRPILGRFEGYWGSPLSAPGG